MTNQPRRLLYSSHEELVYSNPNPTSIIFVTNYNNEYDTGNI
jgi:hypothetical protein